MESDQKSPWQSVLNSPLSKEKDPVKLKKNETTPYDVFPLLRDLNITPELPLLEDVTRGLGEAVDRLLILTVDGISWEHRRRLETGVMPPDSEAPSEGGFRFLSNLLRCMARNGTHLELRTVQHMFSRCFNYLQALALFDEIKLAGMAMNAHVYYAMIFCLQRLEEESWGRQYRQELKRLGHFTSEMLHFCLHGVEDQLIPESKPHLGRVMFADIPQVYPYGRSSDFDATGRAFKDRFEERNRFP